MKRNHTQKIVLASLLAALTCVTTMAVKIPSPLNGYINLGDVIVLLAAFLLSPIYGMCAAGVGSALADLFSGYALYAPATLIIKALMALLAYFTVRLLSRHTRPVLARTVGALLAEIWMVLGYYIFEGFLYGFGASLINIPANAVQGAVGAAIGVLLTHLVEKTVPNAGKQ